MWRAMETGLWDHWRKSHVPSTDKCKLDAYKKKERKETPKSIKLNDLSGAFLVLGIGWSLALMVFAFERVVFLATAYGRTIAGIHL